MRTKISAWEYIIAWNYVEKSSMSSTIMKVFSNTTQLSIVHNKMILQDKWMELY